MMQVSTLSWILLSTLPCTLAMALGMPSVSAVLNCLVALMAYRDHGSGGRKWRTGLRIEAKMIHAELLPNADCSPKT
jgi:hypothetical protein